MIVKKPIYRTTGLSVKNNYSKVLKILEERNRTDNLLLSEYMNKWAKKNEVAPYTYQGYMQIINGCMNKAVRKDLIERDLLDKVDRPRRAKIHPSFYSP